ncbi:hypothetical protein CDAR_100761 [Caerostris darwini]|uniref:Uncharacterized protein n=1 Tax=Caerostris darwini TaxID=1538125 RepID=A0AAV4VX01_9ARAC|nr:hypothetical protein CDAR_100761 [Caerostris darwini]
MKPNLRSFNLKVGIMLEYATIEDLLVYCRKTAAKPIFFFFFLPLSNKPCCLPLWKGRLWPLMEVFKRRLQTPPRSMVLTVMVGQADLANWCVKSSNSSLWT